MGQKTSCLESKFNINSQFFLKFRRHETTKNPNPEQPIKFQYKIRRKKMPDKSVPKNNQVNSIINNIKTIKQLNKSQEVYSNSIKNINVIEMCKIIKTQNRTRRKCLNYDSVGEKHRHRGKTATLKKGDPERRQFGYEIQDLDQFLSQATLEKPANIPVVLAFSSVLYQTQIGGYQDEVALPLGMVVNAVFKKQNWLYVQTPHSEEGYVNYASCLPLGIIPTPETNLPAPCWEKSTDVFPKPSGNVTDIEKLSTRSDRSLSRRCYSQRWSSDVSTCEEQSVDSLYLKASAQKIETCRQTLLLVNKTYYSTDKNSLSVRKGDIVVLVDKNSDWVWVRNKKGLEGFIPNSIADDFL